MKVGLTHPERDFDPDGPLPPGEAALTADLELDTLLDAMGGGDDFLRAVCRRGLHAMLASPAEITYRQHVLADCVANPGVVRELYDIAIAGLEVRRQVFGWMFRDSPDTVVYRSRQLLGLQVGVLRRLAATGRSRAGQFRSEGFTRFFAMLSSQLSQAYFDEMEAHLAELEFRRGTLISARLGAGAKPGRFVLRRHPGERGWRDRLPSLARDGYVFTIAERDEAGMRSLSRIAGRGLAATANALAQSAEHIQGFFRLLRAELGFYLGCLNLRDRLAAAGQPVTFPVPHEPGTGRLSAAGLRDVSLVLTLASRNGGAAHSADGSARGVGNTVVGNTVVGNDVNADGRQLIMITGANQGGKSTFLRSVGLAQLMMQAGMFVTADEFAACACAGIFTHFKREEDATMEKGKLDEELERMSAITDQIAPGALLLCNESFASTNEREGSEIARQVIRALTETGVRIVFVTHLYDLAESCYLADGGLATGNEAASGSKALFLRAQRRPDGSRTFRLAPGEPLPTSYGEDLYRTVFGADGALR